MVPSLRDTRQPQPCLELMVFWKLQKEYRMREDSISSKHCLLLAAKHGRQMYILPIVWEIPGGGFPDTADSLVPLRSDLTDDLIHICLLFLFHEHV